jgi:hypothetical protein
MGARTSSFAIVGMRGNSEESAARGCTDTHVVLLSLCLETGPGSAVRDMLPTETTLATVISLLCQVPRVSSHKGNRWNHLDPVSVTCSPAQLIQRY